MLVDSIFEQDVVFIRIWFENKKCSWLLTFCDYQSGTTTKSGTWGTRFFERCHKENFRNFDKVIEHWSISLVMQRSNFPDRQDTESIENRINFSRLVTIHIKVDICVITLSIVLLIIQQHIISIFSCLICSFLFQLHSTSKASNITPLF